MTQSKQYLTAFAIVVAMLVGIFAGRYFSVLHQPVAVDAKKATEIANEDAADALKAADQAAISARKAADSTKKTSVEAERAAKDASTSARDASESANKPPINTKP